MNNQPAAGPSRIGSLPSAVSLFCATPPDQAVPLDRLPGMTGSLISVARNQTIFHDGKATVLFYKIVSGVVRACKFLNDGRRQIDAFHQSGDIFGLELGGVHRFSAEAVSGCKVIAYRYRVLETLIRNNEAIAPQLTLHAMQRVRQAQHHAALLARRGAVERVAIFLADWAAGAPDATSVALPMSRQDIGDYLGLTMEAVSRSLTQLETGGVIALPNARTLHVKNRLALGAFEI